MRTMNRELLKKSIALFIAAIVVSTAAMSFYYISSEAFHRCDDNRCPICRMIKISGDLVRGGASLALTAAAVAAAFFAAEYVSRQKFISVSSDNLITLKIRLNY